MIDKFIDITVNKYNTNQKLVPNTYLHYYIINNVQIWNQNNLLQKLILLIEVTLLLCSISRFLYVFNKNRKYCIKLKLIET